MSALPMFKTARRQLVEEVALKVWGRLYRRQVDACTTTLNDLLGCGWMGEDLLDRMDPYEDSSRRWRLFVRDVRREVASLGGVHVPRSGLRGMD